MSNPKFKNYGSARVTGPNLNLPVSRQSLSSLRFEALSKTLPSAAGNVAFNQTANLQPNKFACTVKKEEEGHFAAIRLVVVNRGAAAMPSVSALVGVTETAEFSTSQLLSTPTINGVSYPVLSGAADTNGFKAVTWGGAPTTPVPPAPTMQKLALSDWVHKSSVPRTDGGTRPFSIIRPYADGTVQPVPYMSYYTSALQTPQPAMRGRVIQASNANADAVSIPATAMNAAALPSSILCLEVFPIFRYINPVCSVWLNTDSTGAGDSLVSDRISNWLNRACYDISTMDRPVVAANLGCSGIKSTDYTAVLKEWLDAGVPPPSVLVYLPASVNDAGYDLAVQERQYSQALAVAKLCYDYRIPHLFMYGLLPNDGLTITQDNFRKSTNRKMEALAKSIGATWLDFSAVGDGASPERFRPEYKFDALHENEAAIEAIFAPVLALALSRVN
ncbi:MAG: hypothetical protein RSE62_03300 [Citrobacter sp.]